ncbi:pectin acetylesterase-family hydrolase [Bowmanella dokdonensis]|uniref:Pectinacetylesterase n=1 Tax=Bowmanella dokdonensis TaxID=751969 RepID=A0A939DNS0_9ALTE|nr:pectin acetylesterase-family hydrolase [Bowmanella dokdonensis]MBN7826174.1 hypothetical protein [Bowmanella dokdonensis]
MKLPHLYIALLLPLCGAAKVQAQQAPQWQTIQVAPQLTITEEDGRSRVIEPACALETVMDPVEGTPMDNSFRFYFKQGTSDNLLIFFNGGGSCWEDAGCVASLALSDVPGARPAYNPSMAIENTPVGAGGVFDHDNPDNPFRNWSQVFIPYCTGDIHVGSNDVPYTDQDGSITGTPGAPVLVRHRGFDNFLAVREWLKGHFALDNDNVEKLLVTGSSAGGYGATLNFPYLEQIFPHSRAALLADASAAVVTHGFIQNVFSLGKAWNLEHSLAPLFLNRLGTYSALGLNVEIFDLLRRAYPEHRFAQYSTARDAVQVQFLKIMHQLDRGNMDPFSWGLQPTDFLYFWEWNLRMELSLTYLSATTHNYQYYIGAGTVHTVLTDTYATEELPHPFYQQDSAQGVAFTDWLDRFVNARRFQEMSLSYRR